MRLTRKLLGTVARVAFLAIAWTAVARAQAGGGQPSVTTFLSAVNSADDEVKALNAEKTITANDIHLVNVAKISNAGNSAAIARAIAKNAGPIGEMRERLSKSQVIMGVLTAAGVSISQVVALDVNPGNDIHIFYQ